MSLLTLHVDVEVHDMWEEFVAGLRERLGEGLQEWEALALAVREFVQVWENAETRRQRKRYPVLERDGWRCAVPVCNCLGSGNLQVHHIEFRSAGGPDRPENLTTLCNGHHLGLLHRGRMRVTGEAPDHLRWSLGARSEAAAFMVIDGEVIRASEGMRAAPDAGERTRR
jgi:hypothetical protein